MASCRDVNEKCCAKFWRRWKSFVRVIYFFNAAQIEERFLASLGMTATHTKQKTKEGHGMPCPYGKKH
jgi:hypothetical protein